MTKLKVNRHTWGAAESKDWNNCLNSRYYNCSPFSHHITCEPNFPSAFFELDPRVTEMVSGSFTPLWYISLWVLKNEKWLTYPWCTQCCNPTEFIYSSQSACLGIWKTLEALLMIMWPTVLVDKFGEKGSGKTKKSSFISPYLISLCLPSWVFSCVKQKE